MMGNVDGDSNGQTTSDFSRWLMGNWKCGGKNECKQLLKVGAAVVCVCVGGITL